MQKIFCFFFVVAFKLFLYHSILFGFNNSVVFFSCLFISSTRTGNMFFTSFDVRHNVDKIMSDYQLLVRRLVNMPSRLRVRWYISILIEGRNDLFFRSENEPNVNDEEERWWKWVFGIGMRQIYEKSVYKKFDMYINSTIRWTLSNCSFHYVILLVQIVVGW